jgi:hypothetical protein
MTFLDVRLMIFLILSLSKDEGNHPARTFKYEMSITHVQCPPSR